MALAIDGACPPRRALATLLSAGPNTSVYRDGQEGELTETYYIVYYAYLQLLVYIKVCLQSHSSSEAAHSHLCEYHALYRW